MSAIQFTTVIGSDGMIRLPAGIEVPAGSVEVIVKPETDSGYKEDRPTLTHDWLLALAAETERDAPNLPADMAENHDHYAHGKPKS